MGKDSVPQEYADSSRHCAVQIFEGWWSGTRSITSFKYLDFSDLGMSFAFQRFLHFGCAAQRGVWRERDTIYDVRYTIYESMGEGCKPDGPANCGVGTSECGVVRKPGGVRPEQTKTNWRESRDEGGKDTNMKITKRSQIFCKKVNESA
jgi:hypothetical protein